MAERDVTVNLPVGSPDETIKLVEKIIARNTALGVDSPVKDDFDWVATAAGLAVTKALRQTAAQAWADEQERHYEALQIMGLAPGQNLQEPVSLHLDVTQIRDVLLTKYQSNPETLTLYGFDVVVSESGGRRTVAVDLHLGSPDLFLTLCEKIIVKNTAMGAGSVLNNKVNMTLFGTNTGLARTAYDASVAHKDMKEAKNNEALNRLGYAEGQDSETPETAYNLIEKVKRYLLVAYHKHPEELTLWGYDVVISSHLPGPEEGETPPAPPVG